MKTCHVDVAQWTHFGAWRAGRDEPVAGRLSPRALVAITAIVTVLGPSFIVYHDVVHP